MNQERIGKFISELRKKKNLTQEELAEKLNVTNRTISRWETGQSLPDLSMFNPLSEILGVSVNDLMSGERVIEKEYQQKFEQNVVTTVNNVNKKNKIFKNIAYIYLTVCLIILLSFVLHIIFQYEITQKYDEENMRVVEEYNDIRFDASYSGTIYSLVTYYPSDMDTKLVFITYKSSLNDLRDKGIDFKRMHIDLTDPNEKLNHGQSLNLDNINSNKYKIYYTTTPFKTIADSNKKELLNIINESNLIFEK